LKLDIFAGTTDWQAVAAPARKQFSILRTSAIVSTIQVPLITTRVLLASLQFLIANLA
jgi:hypothetical protein